MIRRLLRALIDRYSRIMRDNEDASYGIVRDEDGTPHFRRSL